MGRKLTPDEEVRALKDATREAHEAAQALNQAIREARALAPRLTADFEAHADSEIKQLSNFFTEESNRHAAALNADVERAREMIKNQIMAGEAVFDRTTATVAIRFGGTTFDDQQALPYPNTPPKEDHQ